MQYIKVDGNTAIVEVIGIFDQVTTVMLKEELSNALTAGCTKVVVDFKDTNYIDSATVGELARTRKQIGKENFRVRNPKGEVYKLLRASSLLDWIEN